MRIEAWIDLSIASAAAGLQGADPMAGSYPIAIGAG